MAAMGQLWPPSSADACNFPRRSPRYNAFQISARPQVQPQINHHSTCLSPSIIGRCICTCMLGRCLLLYGHPVPLSCGKRWVALGQGEAVADSIVKIANINLDWLLNGGPNLIKAHNILNLSIYISCGVVSGYLFGTSKVTNHIGTT